MPIPLQYGGCHEKGMRSCTLNVPGIVGLGKAAALAREKMKEEVRRLSELRNGLLPNTCNISFDGMASQVLIAKLNKHMAISSGSACTSATLEPSYVLVAISLGDERAGQSLRFSLGRFSTLEDVNVGLKQIHDLF